MQNLEKDMKFIEPKNRAMNSFKAISAKFLPLLILLGIWTSIVAFSSYPAVYPKFGDLKTKSYYTKLFNKSELSDLASAYKKMTKAEKELKKADEDFLKAEGYQKIAEDAMRPKDIEKYQKKAGKSKQNALERAIKGFEIMFTANQNTFDIYRKKLKTVEVKDELTKKKVEFLSQSAGNDFAKGEKLRQQGASAERQEKYDLYRKADSLQFNALSLQELSFGLIYNDSDAKFELPEDKNETVVDTDTTKTDTTKPDKTKPDNNSNTGDKNETYNPDTDKNLYKSKSELILPKLSLSKEEKTEFKNSEAIKKEADDITKASDITFLEIENLKENLKKETSQTSIKQIQAQIADKEILVYSEMIKAANLYLQSTENKYNVYKTHFAEARPTNAPDKAKKGLDYEQNAAKLYENSKNTTANATFQPYKSDEYLVLMEALQSALFAVQEQENAYSVYFGFPVEPLPTLSVTDDTKSTGTDNSDVVKTDTTKPDSTTNKSSKTQKYNYKGSFFYTFENPKHQKLVHAKGLIYKVQVGVFKDTLSAKKYKKFQPISYDAFVNNAYKRYMFGEWRTAAQAEQNLTEIKKVGFTDAYIVAYIDGKRTSYTKVKEAVKADETVDKPVSTDSNLKKFELPELNYGTEDYDFVKGTDVRTTKGLVYAVQFGLFKMPKTNIEIKYIKPLMQEHTPGGVKYMQGPFTSYDEAAEAKNGIVKKGFESAFVTAYRNGEPVSVSDAKKTEGSTKKNTPTKTEKVYFSIQIGAFAAGITPQAQARFDAISKTYTIISRKDAETGLTIYSAGQFTDYTVATVEKNKLKAAGYTDIFLIAYKDETKINIADALKLQKP